MHRLLTNLDATRDGSKYQRPQPPGHQLPLPMRRSNGLLSTDLLDANEATWAFVMVGRVGCDENRQVKELKTLASNDASWSYWGRTADGILA